MGRDERRGAALYLTAFLVPAAVMLWTYASLGLAPWGDKTVLVSDMSSQYVEFFCALKNGELLFSWSKALGTGYLGVFSYYVSSPLSLLTLFAPNEEMPVALMLLIVLKVGLAGLSFAVFARRRFPGHDGAAGLCALCYGLMSYSMVYSICVMWLDGLIWLPLILLALERILAGRGAGPFIAVLSACFLSTWYISYMVGGFCALYLCARLIALRPEGRALKQALGRFFGGAACALGLTAWMWLPTFLAMFNGKFGGGNVDYDGLLACDPGALLGQLLPGRYASITYGAPPYLFCGSAALLGAIAYFFLGRVPRRERLANLGVLAAACASLVLSPLDKVWHLFQRPNWFPFRWAFLASFFLLYLAVQSLGAAEERLRAQGRLPARAGAAALAALTVLELGFNARAILGGLEGQFHSASYREYREYYAANAALTAAAREDAEGRFFRMGAAEDRGHNSPLSFGYPGITHYSSLYNYGVNRTLKALGFAQSWMWCAYYGSTPVTDVLLGVEYIVSKDDMPTGYERIAQAGELTLWKNPSALPLAFCPEALEETLWGGTPFERQNNLLCCLAGTGEPVFSPVSAQVSAGAGETVFTFTGTGRPVYADLSASGLREVLVNGEHLLWLGSSEAASVHYLGTPNRGEAWTVAVRSAQGWSGRLWELDMDALGGAARRLDNTQIASVEKNGRVRLAVEDETAGGLAATIPAEDGWTAWVDGKKTETGRWLDTFLYVELPAGAREVELRYTPPGLVPGLGLGALALAGLAAGRLRGKGRAS
mgnify:FL=1